MAKQKPVKQPTTSAKKPTTSSGSNTFTYIIRNLIVTAGFGLLFLVFWNMYSKQRHLSELTDEFYRLRATNPNSPQLRDIYNEVMMVQPEVIGDTSFVKKVTRGYHWAIHDMCLGSLDNIEKLKEEIHNRNEDSTATSYLEARMKRKIGLYTFFEYINKNTPKDAVLLLPYGDSAISNNSKWNFIYDPEWAEYFIYPRKCLSAGNMSAHKDLASKITHVVIIEGKGYDKLHYDVPMEQRVPEAVLPIDKPVSGTTPQ